jgi:hypothetical protein
VQISDKELKLKGLIMTKKNPEDSVREEQFGADTNAAGTEEATQAENAPIDDNLDHEENILDKPELVIGNEKVKKKRIASVKDKKEEPEQDDVHGFDDIELPPVDYSGYSKHEIVETLGLLIENRPALEIKDDIERLKILFYKKLKLESDERKKKFLEDGGKIEDYRVWVDPDDAKVKHLLEKYKEKRTDYSKVQEAEKYENLKKKYDIIDKIKDLVNREESINKTFHEFRALQNEWHTT